MKKVSTEINVAFVDGQNLHLGTSQGKRPWNISHKKFRKYLAEKYHAAEVYYFLGYMIDEYSEMYEDLQKAGFILVFREHNEKMATRKKGNVDTDIVFSIMKKICEKEIVGKVILVSGDGDYYRMVKYLIEKNKLKKVLLPSKDRASSLYRTIDSSFVCHLDDKDVKKKIKL